MMVINAKYTEDFKNNKEKTNLEIAELRNLYDEEIKIRNVNYAIADFLLTKGIAVNQDSPLNLAQELEQIRIAKTE